jgi:hypothetical protein
MGKINSVDVDRYINFSCKKNLLKMHEELMVKIEACNQRKN